MTEQGRVVIVRNGEIICAATAGGCLCGREPQHEPPHVCVNRAYAGDKPCGAEWAGEFDTPTFRAIKFPPQIIPVHAGDKELR